VSRQLGSPTTTRFTRTKLSDIVHPVSSSQLTQDPDRVRSFGGYNRSALHALNPHLPGHQRQCSGPCALQAHGPRKARTRVRHVPGPSRARWSCMALFQPSKTTPARGALDLPLHPKQWEAKETKATEVLYGGGAGFGLDLAGYITGRTAFAAADRHGRDAEAVIFKQPVFSQHRKWKSVTAFRRH